MRYWSAWRGIWSRRGLLLFWKKVAKKLLGEGKALNADSKG